MHDFFFLIILHHQTFCGLPEFFIYRNTREKRIMLFINWVTYRIKLPGSRDKKKLNNKIK